MLFLLLLFAMISGGLAREGGHLSSEDVRSLLNSRHNSLWIPVTNTTVPWYVMGDFNGDGVPDVAAVVRPNEDEFVRQLAVDRKWSPPNAAIFKPLGTGMRHNRYSDNTVSSVRLLKQYSNATLVLIMHSVLPQEASRFDVKDHVVVDLCGSKLTHISVRHGPLRSATAGDSPVIPAPRRLGDAIQGASKTGTRCALYWNGLEYRWHPVE